MSRGALIKFQIGDGETSETFSAINGIESFDFRVNREVKENSNLASGHSWRDVSVDAGGMSLSLNIEGVYNGLPPDDRLAACAINGSEFNARIYFSGGDNFFAAFVAANYRRFHSNHGKEMFSAVLENSGEVIAG